MSDARTLRLTDDGIEVPEALRGFTGQLHIENPTVDMTATIVPPGLGETSRAVLYPPEGSSSRLPDGHIRMQGELYRIIDDRTEVSSDE